MLHNRLLPLYTLLAAVTFHPLSAGAQAAGTDSVSMKPALKIACIGVPLIAEGLLVKSEDKGFRQLRDQYTPHFHSSADDYLRFLPAAVMLGMKVGGVESRSSWGRMLTSDALSTAIMATAVVSLKNIFHETRPDGSDHESFPSGHSAVAFMTATMLTKEYGHLSPWIGIGAYTLATGTATMRLANNKHWFSDVMAGAGIGIISAEMGYYLTDLIFKDRGLNRSSQAEIFRNDDRPSFAGVYVGFGLPLNDCRMSDGATYKTTSGNTIGGEGAWFFNPFMGVGARLLLSNMAIETGSLPTRKDYYDYYSITAGPYFSYPLTSRLLIGSHLTAGLTHYSPFHADDLTRPACDRFTAGTGVALSLRPYRHFSFRIFLDYDLYGPQNHRWLHTLTPGTTFAATL